MKKVLLLLAIVLGFCINAIATNYTTGDLSNKKPWSSSGNSATLNNVTWKITTTQGNYASDKSGFKIGSNTTPAKSVSLKTSDITGNVSKILVTTSCGSSWNGSVSVTVNGTDFNCEDATVVSAGSTLEFSGTATGEIVVNWAMSSGKGAVYIKEIQVEYQTGGGEITTAPELPVVTFNGITAENNGDYEVAKGTVVTVKSANATSITVTDVNDEVTTISSSNGTLIVNDDNMYIITGHNGNLTSEDFAISFTVKETTTPVTPPSGSLTATVTMSLQDLPYGTGSGKNQTQTWISDDKKYEFVTKATINGSTYPTINKDGNLRIYNSNGNTITVNAPDGYTFVSANCALSNVANKIAIDGTTVSDKEVYTFKNDVTSFKLTSVKSNNNNNSDVKSMTFVLKAIKSAEPVEYTPTFVPISLYPDETSTIVLPGETHPAVSFTSADPAIATVSAGGVITAVAEGNTTITVSWEGDNTWVAGSATINVEVKRPLADPGLSFRHAEIRGKLNVGVAAQAAYHVSPGKITYSSSNEAVVKVNPNTGMIIPANVFAVGEAIITASIEATEEYRAATATYKIIIENPAVVDVVDDGPAMFDFREEGCYGFKTNSYSGTATKYEYDFDNPVMSIQEGVVTLDFDPESQFRSFNGSSDIRQLRIYGGAKFSFSVPEGYSIAKIVFNQISNKSGCNIIENVADGASALGTITVDSDPEIDDSEVKSCREWIANDGVTASTVNFTMSTTAGHVRIRTISVQIKKADSTRQLPGLAFENRVYNTFVNEETPVNCATKQTEENVDIFYSIDNLTDDEYTIFAEDNGGLKVMVTTPGVYTLRAKSNPTETTLPGIAILRLNVFPKYDLAHNAEEIDEELMIVPAEGGKLNFNQLPSTLELKLKRSGDEEFTTHDGSELIFADDETIEFYMLYAETYEHGHTTLNVVTRPTVPTHDQQGEVHQFAPSKGAYLYYTQPTKYVKATQTKLMAAAAEPEWNQIATAEEALEVNPADFQMADNEYVRFQAKSVKKVANREVEGPAQYFTILSNGNLSGVEDIEIEAADVRYFNLNGVAVDADALTPGIYIRHHGSKAEKVVIR